MCKVEPNNKYKKEWEELKGAKPAPNSFRKICEIDYSDFELLTRLLETCALNKD